MKRWAISKLGEYEGTENGIVPKVILYAGNVRLWAKPGFNWAFCQVASNDFTAMQADPDIYVLPDGTMDMSVGSIPAGVRTTMKSRLEAAGFVFTDVKTSWTVRRLLNYLVQQLQPTINVENGDIPDVT